MKPNHATQLQACINETTQHDPNMHHPHCAVTTRRVPTVRPTQKSTHHPTRVLFDEQLVVVDVVVFVDQQINQGIFVQFTHVKFHFERQFTFVPACEAKDFFAPEKHGAFVSIGGVIACNQTIHTKQYILMLARILKL
jgi:hypothetical protein